MSEPDIVPEQPSEQHFQIGQKGADRLGRLVDGNGLKAEQVRLARHETLVHQLPGEVSFELKPDVVKGQLKGNRPVGIVCGSEADVMGRAEGLAQEFLKAKDIHIELLQLLDHDPGRGWGIEPFKHPLAITRKEFSVVDKCTKCAGQTYCLCGFCQGNGVAMCGTCNGQGLAACSNCSGSAWVTTSDGGRAPCGRCNQTGRVYCGTCQGAKQLRCTSCGGQGKVGCTECDKSGFWTHTFDMTFHAEARFDLDRQQVPPDVLEIVDRLGVRELATEGHAEIFRLFQNPEQKFLIVPFVAFLPLCNAEFSIEGKQYPSGIAGLTGRIMGIDPVLDPVLKPGINALFKLSKGPLATEALIAQSCKYRALRQVITGLSHHSKKHVYQTLRDEYPLVISDKFLKAAIKYADIGILALSKGPRLKGLLLGTVAATLVYAAYYIGPLRKIALDYLIAQEAHQHIRVVDFVAWVAGWLAAWLSIKFMARGALDKLLPEEVVDKSDKGLPAAGPQGWQAAGTTLAAWAACAFFAELKPGWVLTVLQLIKR